MAKPNAEIIKAWLLIQYLCQISEWNSLNEWMRRNEMKYHLEDLSMNGRKVQEKKWNQRFKHLRPYHVTNSWFKNPQSNLSKHFLLIYLTAMNCHNCWNFCLVDSSAQRTQNLIIIQHGILSHAHVQPSQSSGKNMASNYATFCTIISWEDASVSNMQLFNHSTSNRNSFVIANNV